MRSLRLHPDHGNVLIGKMKTTLFAGEGMNSSHTDGGVVQPITLTEREGFPTPSSARGAKRKRSDMAPSRSRIIADQTHSATLGPISTRLLQESTVSIVHHERSWDPHEPAIFVAWIPSDIIALPRPLC